ncbi:MAG: cell division ATP-binding protein FtsE [Bacillota bacterium]|uniref:cell division ATP-binding protein FtsE n=1 Tax=Desulfurispora thermophila TaxID=265470 RepID=UPI00036E7526|nr:cell division ATP-binding protein FtsE [Desulfurispora thermophila]
MLNLYNVTKVYPNEIKALDDISLTIKKGEFVFLVGPSGAGKTTLTKIIFREELPTRGQVLFNGKNILRLRGKEVALYRRKIGMVFQDFRLLPQKTVFENVAFALQVSGAGKQEISRKVPEALARVGLQGKENVLPAQLSGGEQQRVSIARAIVREPVLLIADEPTGNLDPDTAWELMELFQKINEQGTTIIMSTHAREIVDAMQKRVIALSGGRVVRDQESGGYRHESF